MFKPNTVEWHEQCLKNMTASLARKTEELERVKTEHYRLTRNVYAREQQIARAKREGKASFDDTRYNPTG